MLTNEAQSAGIDELRAMLKPGEQFFALVARDPDFEFFVRMWAHWRSRQIACGLRPETPDERAKITEAHFIATEASIWRQRWLTQEQVAGMTFDDRGVPTSGPHARIDRPTGGTPSDG